MMQDIQQWIELLFGGLHHERHNGSVPYPIHIMMNHLSLVGTIELQIYCF